MLLDECWCWGVGIVRFWLEEEDESSAAGEQAGEAKQFQRRILTEKDSRSGEDRVKVVGWIGKVG